MKVNGNLEAVPNGFKKKKLPGRNHAEPYGKQITKAAWKYVLYNYKI
jgi:hypothetical protein